MAIPGSTEERVAALRRRASHAAILLDLDGTLSPIAERPELARLQPGVRDVLHELVSGYALVAVVSGRPAAQVAPLVDVDGIRIAGLYGLDEREAEPVAQAVDRAVADLAAEMPGAVVERKGPTIALHVRGTGDPDDALARATSALAPVAASASMEILAGKRVLELVPLGSGLKGGAVRSLLASASLDAALYAGDDRADLEAMAALEELDLHLRVAVRGPETPRELLEAADLVVDGPGRHARAAEGARRGRTRVVRRVSSPDA